MLVHLKDKEDGEDADEIQDTAVQTDLFRYVLTNRCERACAVYNDVAQRCM